jgi:hypothetical protein
MSRFGYTVRLLDHLIGPPQPQGGMVSLSALTMAIK